MTNHLLYEGSTLERVLERVQEDHGEVARIIAADRTRRGGIGGFFTKEVFQVTVEVPTLVDTPDDTSGDATRADGEAIGQIVPRRRLLGAGAVTEFTPAGDQRVPSGEFDRDEAGGSTVNLFGQLGGVVDGPGFAASLAEAMAAPLPLASLEPQPPRIVSGLVHHASALVVGSAPMATTMEEPPTGAGTNSWAAARLSALASVSSSPEAGGSNVVSLQPHRVRRTAASPSQLNALLAELDREWREPAALPKAGVVAVVGSVDEARRGAVGVALAAGVALDDVVVASPTDPSDAPTAQQIDLMRASLLIDGVEHRPVIVVIEVHPGRPGHDWARLVLAGLQPDHVRYAVSGTKSADAVSLAMTALGGVGMFDVIDLLDAESAAEPEEFLGLGVPVATIDGRPASAMLWAATVLAVRSQWSAAASPEGEAGSRMIDQAGNGGR